MLLAACHSSCLLCCPVLSCHKILSPLCTPPFPDTSDSTSAVTFVPCCQPTRLQEPRGPDTPAQPFSGVTLHYCSSTPRQHSSLIDACLVYPQCRANQVRAAILTPRCHLLPQSPPPSPPSLPPKFLPQLHKILHKPLPNLKHLQTQRRCPQHQPTPHSPRRRGPRAPVLFRGGESKTG